MLVFQNDNKKNKGIFKKIPEGNIQFQMQSLLDEQSEVDNLPPINYTEYMYSDILKWCEKKGNDPSRLPLEVIDLKMLKWCISAGHNAYHRYCKEHFAHYLKDQ